jgi:hypothetical protein
MVGSWQRYWKVIKWHFVPFRMINRRYLDFIGTNFTNVVLVLGTNILCLFAYILEYMLIKAIFIR